MGKYRLKRKTLSFLGIGNMSKNWNAGINAFKQRKIMSGLGNTAKAIGTAGVYTAGATAAIGGLAAHSVFDKMTGEG